MATHTNSTPTTPKPIIDLTTPRKQAETALYEIGVIGDIIEKLATIIISTNEQVCGTSFDWLATELAERHQTLEELISVGSFGRGG